MPMPHKGAQSPQQADLGHPSRRTICMREVNAAALQGGAMGTLWLSCSCREGVTACSDAFCRKPLPLPMRRPSSSPGHKLRAADGLLDLTRRHVHDPGLEGVHRGYGRAKVAVQWRRADHHCSWWSRRHHAPGMNGRVKESWGGVERTFVKENQEGTEAGFPLAALYTKLRRALL